LLLFYSDGSAGPTYAARELLARALLVMKKGLLLLFLCFDLLLLTLLHILNYDHFMIYLAVVR
jgi:hypothetical protein